MKIKSIKKYKYLPINILLCVSLCIEGLTLYILLKSLKDNKREHIETLNKIELNINYSNISVYNRLNSAVNNNVNLNNREKEMILRYLFVFVQNKDYIDIDYVEKCLLTLKINYIDDIKQKGNISTNGTYSDKKNEINFYHANNIDEVNITTFTHEMFHIMQKVYVPDYNSYLIETINSMYNEEYTYRDEESLYTEYYNFIKMLIEIIGVKPIKSFQGYTSVNPIIESLTNIYGDEKDAYELLYELDNYKRLYESIDNDNNFINDIKNKNLEKCKNIIINKLSLYYENKFGKKMSDDLIMLYYYNKEELYRTIGINTSQVINIKNDIRYFFNPSSQLIIIYNQNVIKKELTFNNGKIIEKDIDENAIKYSYLINEDNRYFEENKTLKKH